MKSDRHGPGLHVDQLYADPHMALAGLRREAPVIWAPDFEAWIVTTRDLCVEVLRNAETFTVDDDRFSTRQVVGPSMLSLDGLEHRRHRIPFAPAFRERPVRVRLEAWTKEQAAALVQQIAGDGKGDLRANVAAPLAAMVMSHLLGLVDVGVDQLLDWNDQITCAIDEVTVGRDVPESGAAAFDELRAAVAGSMKSGGLLTDVDEHGDLDLDEIAANVAVLLIGGIVTSDGAMSVAFHHLLTHPDMLEQVAADPDLIPPAIEESMRLEPAAAFVDRYAARPVRLGPAQIDMGDLVRVSISAANRDPAVFSEPDRFDIRRPNLGEHIAFARGPHACLGFHVARLEARVAIEAVIGGLDGLRAAPGDPAGPVGLIFRSPPRVQAVWAGDSTTIS